MAHNDLLTILDSKSNVLVTHDKALTISDNSSGFAIAQGHVNGVSNNAQVSAGYDLDLVSD